MPVSTVLGRVQELVEDLLRKLSADDMFDKSFISKEMRTILEILQSEFEPNILSGLSFESVTEIDLLLLKHK